MVHYFAKFHNGNEGSCLPKWPFHSIVLPSRLTGRPNPTPPSRDDLSCPLRIIGVERSVAITATPWNQGMLSLATRREGSPPGIPNASLPRKAFRRTVLRTGEAVLFGNVALYGGSTGFLSPRVRRTKSSAKCFARKRSIWNSLPCEAEEIDCAEAVNLECREGLPFSAEGA